MKTTEQATTVPAAAVHATPEPATPAPTTPDVDAGRWPDHPDGGAAGYWAIVPGNSTAGFAVRNFGLRMVHGVVPIVDATVVVSGAADRATVPTVAGVSEVHLTLSLAGIDTANVRRDHDLRARRLLDTEHHPDLLFACGDVRADTTGWRLDGTLTAHGCSTAVTVDAVLVSGPVRDHVTVRATTTFDRRALGIRAPRFMIGRDVVVTVTTQFRLLRADGLANGSAAAVQPRVAPKARPRP